MKKSMIVWLLAGCLAIAGKSAYPVQAAEEGLESQEYSDGTELVNLEESSSLNEDLSLNKAVSYKAGGDCGDDLKWSLDYDGNLVIYGTGEIPWGFTMGWATYKSEIQKITVEEGCTAIAGFGGCENLTTVLLPSSLKKIKEGTFKECTSLPSLSLPSGLKEIRDAAFQDCIGLTSITLPNGLESFGTCVFMGSGLTSITVPDSVTDVSAHTFEACPNLTSATINGKNSLIGWGAFSNCPKLTTVKMGSGIRAIDSSAFENCSSLQNVTIGENVTYIEKRAFANCTALKEISIPDKVTRITSFSDYADGSFEGCTSLTKVTFGVGLDTIGACAFKDCIALKEIFFCGAAPKFRGNDNIFTGCGTITGYYPVNSKTWDRSVWTPHGAEQINWQTWTPPINHFSPKLKSITPTNKGVKLTWENMSGASGYRIFRKTGNESWKQVKEITGQNTTSWTDTGLKNGKRYTWRICAVSGNVQSQVSDSLYQYYLTTIAKKNLKLSSKNGVLTVKWKKNKSASGYKIEYGKKKNFSGAKKKTVKKAKTVKTTIKLSKKKTYYVRIRAYKTVDGKTSYGAWSDAKKIKIK